jgi:hypothetical protein
VLTLLVLRCWPCTALVQAVLYCLAWSAASSSLIFLNKHLLTDDGFHYPMTLCSMGCVQTANQHSISHVLSTVFLIL